MRPAAGGETGTPRAQRGTRLKATTDRASLVSAGLPPPAWLPKRLVHHCRPCGAGSPRSNPRQTAGRESTSPARPHRARAASSPSASPGGFAAPRAVGRAPMTARIRQFLRTRADDGPCLVVDLDVVRENYLAFAKALPDTKVFYAVKANPAPEVLALLAALGSSFDAASVTEIEMVLAAGAPADRISFGNTIKKERDVARAHALGVRLYAVDCPAEVDKIARAAPGARVFCRILSDCVGAEWPLSRKCGCEPAMAVDVLEHAHRLGLEAYGVSFHVGSQQRNPHAWDRALASAAAVFRECGERGMSLQMVNLGGGFPTKYLKNVPTVKTYGSSIIRALRKHFGNRIPETIIEPGRGMVGN